MNGQGFRRPPSWYLGALLFTLLVVGMVWGGERINNAITSAPVAATR